MKILVTGGAGFIGSNIVDSYVQAGHNVWVIDDESYGKKENINKKARYQKVNVVNSVALREVFVRGRFDVVNHLAAQIDVRGSVLDPVNDAKINILGLLNVLNLCVEFNVKKIIFSASGGTAYGECTRPATEQFPERPLSPYGVAKLAGEKYIQAFESLHQLKYTIFRYANVYGPRQDPHGEAGVVAIFSERLLKNQEIAVYGSGNQTRDFVFVKDVAKANLIALHRGDNQIFNIGTGRETSINQLLSLMSSLAHYRRPPKRKPLRAGELKRSVLAISKAKASLGWAPQFSLKEGLAQTLSYFSNKLNL